MSAAAAVVMDRGIDYAGGRPSPKSTFKAGGRFVNRYSAGAGNQAQATQFKLCGRGEIADLVGAGLDFHANSEWYESRVTEGAPAGRADGAADLRFWQSRGLAAGATIYVSWDEAPARGAWGRVDAYLKAYRAELHGHYQVGAYAGTPYLRHALAGKVIAHGWRPNAGSWSNDGLPYAPATGSPQQRRVLVARALKATPAAIYQTGNYWWGKDADENLILRPSGSHLQAIAAAQAARQPAKHQAPPPAKTPAAPPAQPHYPNSGDSYAHALSSQNRAWAVAVTDDGRLALFNNGKITRYL